MTGEAEQGRVAVLSDIHGVLPALEAVLAEPEVAAAERIVLTDGHRGAGGRRTGGVSVCERAASSMRNSCIPGSHS